MIHSISSSLPSFKTLKFRPGFNVIVADKSEGATGRQTRNSSGKTSIAWILHHLLGANCDANSIFRAEELCQHSFEMRFDLARQKVTATRTGATYGRMVVDANLSEWSVQPKLDSVSGETSFTVSQWTEALGESMFGLQPGEKLSPTFRSCIPYFIRREWDGGFDRPENAFKQMSAWNQQVNLSFLLGLDWHNPQKLERLRQQEKTIRELKKDGNHGILRDLVGTTGELKTRLAVAEKRLSSLQQQLNGFQVLPEYRELEKEASTLAVRISQAANEIAVQGERASVLENQLRDEQPPRVTDLEKMYSEASVVLPELVCQRLSDVQKFHERVLRNRRTHLQGELDRIRNRITELDKNRSRSDQCRLEILQTLSSRGAIDQLQKLQAEQSRVAAETEELRRRLDTATRIEETRTKLTIERAQVQQSTLADHREHDSVIREAVLLFEDFSRRISDHEGSLMIDVTENGPMFSVQVEGGRSVGIRNMQVFCFDLMLSVLWAQRGMGPGFLFHDSHLFDGVDERQVAAALQLGCEQSNEHGFQYIVTLNSDMIPQREFSPDFDFDNFVNPVRLSDAEETGGLFGLRIR